MKLAAVVVVVLMIVMVVIMAARHDWWWISGVCVLVFLGEGKKGSLCASVD